MTRSKFRTYLERKAHFKRWGWLYRWTRCLFGHRWGVVQEFPGGEWVPTIPCSRCGTTHARWLYHAGIERAKRIAEDSTDALRYRRLRLHLKFRLGGTTGGTYLGDCEESRWHMKTDAIFVSGTSEPKSIDDAVDAMIEKEDEPRTWGSGEFISTLVSG